MTETTGMTPGNRVNETEKFETIRYTADTVVTTTDDHVLLIERGWDPHKGQWALPGGHVDPGETSRTAAARELAEEAGVYAAPNELTQIGVFDQPDRDPRGRYVTVAYHLTVVPGTIIEARDDAADAQWWPLNALPPLAFDHSEIVHAAQQQLADREARQPLTY
ncbi:NUDIX domain-containing protein [Streptomyces sp. NPDC048157]|uniref:NUDIX domain-containing protein n=1 Tax=Streptomyces sp. NPDC048157 TaxID=3365503 RepID=UPI0037229D87